MNSFISRIKRIEDMDTVSDGKESLIFAERSIYTDKRCFAELCYENGKTSGHLDGIIVGQLNRSLLGKLYSQIDEESGYKTDENFFQWLFKGKSKR